MDHVKNVRVEALLDRFQAQPERRDRAVRLYIGWTHKTEDFEEELERRLKVDINEERIRIVDKLADADLYTPLVCAGNIVSPEFEEDLKKALGLIGQVQILPIWLFPISGVDYQMKILATFGGLPGRNRTWFEGPDREETWAEVLRGIRYAAARLRDHFNLRSPR